MRVWKLPSKISHKEKVAHFKRQGHTGSYRVACINTSTTGSTAHTLFMKSEFFSPPVDLDLSLGVVEGRGSFPSL